MQYNLIKSQQIKIKNTLCWQNTGYLGIPEIEEGARLTLTFERAKNGISYLRKIEKNEGQ